MSRNQMADSFGVHTLAHVDKEKGRKSKFKLSEEKQKTRKSVEE